MTTVTVNDSLVKLDNVLTALNYLLEEVETRKNTIMNRDNFVNEIKSLMDTDDFKYNLHSFIRNRYGEGICREVSHYVMDQIDSDIDAFINNRVRKILKEYNVIPQDS